MDDGDVRTDRRRDALEADPATAAAGAAATDPDDSPGRSPSVGVERLAPASDAYGALGSETRVAILRAMVDGNGDVDGNVDDGGATARPTATATVRGRPRTFSELYEATDEETTAGFAYHLRQLRGTYLVRAGDGDAGEGGGEGEDGDGVPDVDDGDDGDDGDDAGGSGYVLTAAGLAAARDLAAGTHTDRVESDPIPVEDDCPLCGESELRAAVADGFFGVDCVACDRDLLAVPAPPGTATSRAPADLPGAVDVRVRNRIATLSAGVCPSCGGPVEARTERAVDDAGPGSGPGSGSGSGSGPVPDPGPAPGVWPETVEAAGAGAADAGADGDSTPVPVRATFVCERCGDGLRCPAALATLDHPAVVAFYHDHGIDVRDRPVWNVGVEWRERLVSTDPWCVVVTTALGGERLLCYLDRSAGVVETRRRGVATGS